MADKQTEVHIGENSPEHVAFKLFKEVAAVELYGNQPKAPTRQWILDTYAECLRTVRDPFGRSK
jgi:hypothetical protein